MNRAAAPRSGHVLLYVLLAAIGAYLLALLGGFLGNSLAWSDPNPLPDNARATEIAQIGFSDVDPTTIQRQDFVFDFDVPADSFGVGDDATPGYVRFSYPMGYEHDDFASRIAQADQLLRDRGWTVQTRPGEIYGPQLVGYNDMLVIEFSANSADGTIEVLRREPASTGLFTIVGVLGGAIVGAMLGYFGTRRLVRSTPILVMAIVATVVTAISSIPVGFGLIVLLSGPLLSYPPDAIPLWGVYYLIPPMLFLFPVAVLAGIGVAIAIAASFIVRSKRPDNEGRAPEPIV